IALQMGRIFLVSEPIVDPLISLVPASIHVLFDGPDLIMHFGVRTTTARCIIIRYAVTSVLSPSDEHEMNNTLMDCSKQDSILHDCTLSSSLLCMHESFL
ncbi:hypothetical protein BHM03_00022069, partial [Ensete ventricosum]